MHSMTARVFSAYYKCLLMLNFMYFYLIILLRNLALSSSKKINSITQQGKILHSNFLVAKIFK